jgi:hypothetical protein
VPVAVVDRKSKPDGPAPIVVVVDVEVELVVLLDVDDVLLVDVLLVVLDDVDVLLELDVDVLLVVDDEVLVELVDDVEVLLVVELEVDVDDVLLVDVLLVVELEVEVVDVLLVEDDVELEVEVLLVVDDEVELDVDDELLLDVELDVLVLVVVVVAFGLQRASSGPNSGTAAWSMQSVLNSVTQSTQVTRSFAVTTAPLQLDGVPSKGLPYGQVAGNPIDATGTSPLPSQSLSGPPHALQMVVIFFVSALLRRSAVLPVASTGQVLP